MGAIYSYEIEPHPFELGGGWRLRLIENGVEVGGGVFLPIGDMEEEGSANLAAEMAYGDAPSEASIWLATQE